jgi:tripartite-type tricarboxylate transporter receptor subunit TctC
MTGLAIDGAQRSPLFPDIPTLAELGYRSNLTRVYFGLLAPAGTPKLALTEPRLTSMKAYTRDTQSS